MHMSGCRVNMFVMPVQVLYSFYRCKTSKLQNKPFGVHEQFMPDKCKVKYVSIITDQTLENTKNICETVGGLCQLQRMALLVMYDVLPTTK